MQLLDRITVRLTQMWGKPCIRGMRIPVSEVLGLLAHGLSEEQVLKQLRTWNRMTSERHRYSARQTGTQLFFENELRPRFFSR